MKKVKPNYTLKGEFNDDNEFNDEKVDKEEFDENNLNENIKKDIKKEIVNNKEEENIKKNESNIYEKIENFGKLIFTISFGFLLYKYTKNYNK
jgi:hypothetical protein